jgi:hypothetical protein
MVNGRLARSPRAMPKGALYGESRATSIHVWEALMSKFAIAIATGALLLAGPALAAKTKNCGTTTTTDTVKPNGGFTQTTTTTTTQTSSCNSNSDTGQQTTTDTGPVTNRGGGTPGGQQ